jgi:hypothetical protein
VRDLAGQELALPSWDRAMNLMLINVSTRKFRRAVRLARKPKRAFEG